MTWLIVALLLIAAFGPMLWLLPTRKDRRLARMRARARTLGLSVQLTPIRKRDATPDEVVSAGGNRKNPTLTVAAYRRPVVRPMNYVPPWKVDRSSSGDAGPLPGWMWDVRPAAPESGQLEEVWRLVDALPDDVVSVEATRLDVAAFWLERASDDAAESAVNSLDSALGEIAEAMISLNDRIEARAKREKSS